jgi:hypothetical protein
MQFYRWKGGVKMKLKFDEKTWINILRAIEKTHGALSRLSKTWVTINTYSERFDDEDGLDDESPNVFI